MPPTPTIIGPTAIGKTAAALHIATHHPNFELISADSQQVYIGMDIGTGKEVSQGQWQHIGGRPTLVINGVPIHGLNLTTPDKPFSVAQWADEVQHIIASIHQRGKQPLIVGGTGFYLQALQGNIQTLHIQPNHQLRQELSDYTADQLYQRLAKNNPHQAHSLNQSDRHNPVRLIRLIEIAEHQRQEAPNPKRQTPNVHLRLIGLTQTRSDLYRAADQRIDHMIDQGLVAEVQHLIDQYGANHQAFKAIGYQQIIQHLQGQASLDQAISTIKHQTHTYIRRQYTWFNKQPVTWINKDQPNWQETLTSQALETK